MIKEIKSYNLFHTLYLSFFSKPLYQNVAKNWKGLCLPYLLFILTIYWIPEIGNLHTEASEYLNDEAPIYIDQVPVITITKGEASIKEAVPYYIYDRNKDKAVAIIDTSGQINTLSNSSALILLTKSTLIVRKSGDDLDTRTLSLADFGEMVINKTLLYEWLEVFKNLFIAILFPIALLFSFGSHILQVLICSLIGTVFAKRLDSPLDFKALFRLSVIAFTPATLLEAVHALLGIPFPYSTFIAMIITLGYLYYAVDANKSKTRTV